MKPAGSGPLFRCRKQPNRRPWRERNHRRQPWPGGLDLPAPKPGGQRDRLFDNNKSRLGQGPTVFRRRPQRCQNPALSVNSS